VRVDVLARRPFFADDHQAYRDSVRTFIERHVEPFVETWAEDRLVPREPWLEAGRQVSWVEMRGNIHLAWRSTGSRRGGRML
jgi:hypothetical protein